MVSATAQAYNGGLSEVQGQSPWSGSQGVKPPEAEALSVFRCSMKVAKFAHFFKI